MDTLIKTASLSASRSYAKDVRIPLLKSAGNTEVSGIADVTRPSGDCEGQAGCVIPHCVGPATLLRHSLPARPSQASELCGLNQSIHKGEPGAASGVLQQVGFRQAVCKRVVFQQVVFRKCRVAAMNVAKSSM